MTKYFADTDVIIDYLTDRAPYSTYSTQILERANCGEIQLWISSLSINNIHYITRKILGSKKALDIINNLVEVIQIQSVGRKEIIDALNSDFKDFEDAIQYFSALQIQGVKAIITRNIKDYKTAEIAVMAPKEILNADKL